VGTATGYELDDQGIRVRVPAGARDLALLLNVQALGHTELHIQSILTAFSPGVKAIGV
jgi:hypothetical protein